MNDTCPHCAELAERVAWLESELGIQRAETRVTKVATALRVNPQAARIILALYDAKGRVVTNMQLWDAIPQVRDPHFDDERAPKLLDVVIWKARQALPGCIRTIHARGRQLTPDGMARVAGVLDEQPQAIAA